MTLTDLRARLSPFVAAYRRYVGPKRQAALMGLLLGLAQPPFGFLPGLLAYAVLMRSLDGDLGPKPVRRAFLIGWWGGFIYFLIGCFWVAEAFMVDASNQGWMAPFAVCLLPAGIALFWGAAFALYRKLTARFWAGHWSRWFFFAGVLCLFDVLRGTILTGFPWNPIGATWKAGSALSQTAALIGVYGLGLLTLLIFTSPAVVARNRGRKGYWPVAVSLALVAGLSVYGQVRLSTARIVDTPLWVRIVQPDIGQQAKWSEGALLKVMRSYVYLSRLPANDEFAKSVTNRDKKPYPDVVLWPEGALPDAAENLLDPQSETALLFNTLLYNRQVLLWGAYHRAIDDNNSLVWRNSMLSLTREGDETTYEVVYSKYKLVPFGEFLPFEEVLEKLGVKELAHVGDGFSPGPRTKPVKAGDLPRFLPLICYEGLFPGLSMQSYGAGNQAERPQWIVNISNDAWFGPTTGPVQHLNLSSFRAIEEGLPMVRSTPTGISGLIDPLGRIVSATEIGIHQAGVRDMWLPAPAEATFYTQWRYLHLILVALFCLIPVSIAIFVNVSKNNDTK
ncbi:MAG: apolipoprotein N-acyltransferase [Asticcacaulis sp.]